MVLDIFSCLNCLPSFCVFFSFIVRIFRINLNPKQLSLKLSFRGATIDFCAVLSNSADRCFDSVVIFIFLHFHEGHRWTHQRYILLRARNVHMFLLIHSQLLLLRLQIQFISKGIDFVISNGANVRKTILNGIFIDRNRFPFNSFQIEHLLLDGIFFVFL